MRGRWGNPALRRLRAVAGIAVALAVLLAMAVTPAAAGSTLKGHFGGYAYGTYANAKAGPISVQLGRSANLQCPCGPDGTNNAVITNGAGNVETDRDIASVVQINTSVQAGKTGNTALVRNVAQLEGISLLGGLITADAITAVAKVNATKSALTASAAESSFVNLKVAGVNIKPNVNRNTRINLPGLGYVTLREVNFGGNGTNRRAVHAIMIHIRVTTNNSFDLPVGVDIKIAHAKAEYERKEPVSLLKGHAWGSSGTSEVLVTQNKLGKSAALWLGCDGTKGKKKNNNVAAMTVIPGIVKLGAATTMVRGEVAKPKSYSLATSKLANVRLLGGLVTATTVKASSRSNWNANTNSGANSTNGSKFVNLKVLGATVSPNVPQNTEITLPLLGYVRLFEVNQTANASGATSQVIMIHIVITTPLNVLDLPVGTEITIAGAETAALPFS